MKHRDPTIRTCRGDAPRAPLIRRAEGPRATQEPRVFRAQGVTPFEARETPKIDRVLPGGLPPVPNRTPWARAGLTGRGAREPFNSTAVKGEFWATKRYLEG